MVRTLLAALAAITLAGAADAAPRRDSGAREMIREADRLAARVPRANPRHSYFSAGRPATVAYVLRLCAQRIPYNTPHPDTCRAAATAGAAQRR